MRPSECTADVWSCAATCACSVGWFGDDCASDEAAWNDVVALRSSMLGALAQASALQDVSAEALNMQASTLSSLVAEPSQLASGADRAALALVGDIAGGSAAVGLSAGTAATIGGSVSSLLDSPLLLNATRNASLAGDALELVQITRAIDDLSAAQLLVAVAGEAAATLATDNLMMSSSRVAATDATGATFSTPENAGGAAPAVTLGSYDAGGGATTVVDTQLRQWGYNVYATTSDAAAAVETASTLVSLSVTMSGAAADDDENTDRSRRFRRRRLDTVDDDAPLTFTLQNIRTQAYGGASKFVNLTCPEDFLGVATAVCPETNGSVSVNCSGRYWNGLGWDLSWSPRLACETTRAPACLVFASETQAYDATRCAAVNATPTTTTCACARDAGGSISITSGSEVLLNQFIDLLGPGQFTMKLFEKNALLLWTFAALAGLALLSSAASVRADARDRAARWTPLEAAKEREHAGVAEVDDLRVAAGVTSSGIAAALANEHTFAFHASQAMPQSFTETSVGATLVRVLHEAHSWISASPFGAYDPVVPRHIRTQLLAINVLWVMASEALMVLLLEPNMGCEEIRLRSDCLALMNPYNPVEHACAWDVGWATPCQKAEPDSANTWTPERMVAILAAMILISPCVSLTEKLFLNVFNAPRRRREPDAAAREREVAQRRWVWNAIAAERSARDRPPPADRSVLAAARALGERVATKFLVARAGDVGLHFCRADKFATVSDDDALRTRLCVVDRVEQSSPFHGVVACGDVLMQIDADVPVFALDGDPAKVAAVMLAREQNPTRLLQFAADAADAKARAREADDALWKERATGGKWPHAAIEIFGAPSAPDAQVETEDESAEAATRKPVGRDEPITIGMALDIWAELTVERAAEFSITSSGNGAERVPPDATNLDDQIELVLCSSTSAFTSAFPEPADEFPEPTRSQTSFSDSFAMPGPHALANEFPESDCAHSTMANSGGNAGARSDHPLLSLPPIDDDAKIDAFIEVVVARNCRGVLGRHRELRSAADTNEATRKILHDFERTWGLGGRARTQRRLHARHLPALAAARFHAADRFRRLCRLCCGEGTLSEEETLERLVRAKARKDVRVALAWNAELEALDGEGAREKLLLEYARFEHLSSVERNVYVSNGGCQVEAAPAPPVTLATKALAAALMVPLLVGPMLFLLLFGLWQGKHTTRCWWTATMTCFALSAVVFEPIQLAFLYVVMPSLVRTKMRKLYDPTENQIFPFRTVLYEYPTSFLAAQHPGLVVARRVLRRRALRAQADGGAADGGGDGAACGAPTTLGAADVRYRTAKTRNRFSRLALFLWGALLLMPEWVQECVIEDILAGLTVVALGVARVLRYAEDHWRAAAGLGVGALFLLVAYLCVRKRTALDAAADAAAQEDADEEDTAIGETVSDGDAEQNVQARQTLSEWIELLGRPAQLSDKDAAVSHDSCFDGTCLDHCLDERESRETFGGGVVEVELCASHEEQKTTPEL